MVGLTWMGVGEREDRGLKGKATAVMVESLGLGLFVVGW